MTTTATETKKRTPRDYDSIEKGALAMPLTDRVKLKNALITSIDEEVTRLGEQAKQAAEIAGVK
jgi:hypothetical protein